MNYTQEELSLLCEKHAGLVQMTVNRHLSRAESREDLVQVAYFGLIRALKSFDPSRGFQFSTYAVPVIEGVLRDHLRRSGTLSVPRSLRTSAARLARARETLGEDASLARLAEEAGISEEDAVLASELSVSPASLSELEEEGTLPAAPDAGYDAVLDRVMLEEGLSHLKKQDAALISLRYFHGLTQEKTARVLSMTQVQVSRAEKRILAFLKNVLKGE